MRDLYKPKITRGFGCSLYGEFLPKNTLYMRTQFGYMWASAYDVKHNSRFTCSILRINDKKPIATQVCGEYGLGLVLAQAVKDIDVEKPIQVINKQTLGGLLPKNQMVSKAYKACAVYAGKETKVKRELYNV